MNNTNESVLTQEMLLSAREKLQRVVDENGEVVTDYDMYVKMRKQAEEFLEFKYIPLIESLYVDSIKMSYLIP